MTKLWGVLGLSLVCGTVLAQENTNSAVSVEWQDGPVVGRMSNVSTLQIPDGYAFTGSAGTKVVMERMGNLVSGQEIGMIVAPSNAWLAVFEFDPCGYVKDDEKNSLDADKMMKSMREGQTQANKRLHDLGRPELTIDGWYKKPFYNEKTHNLEWCTQLREKGTDDPFANHNIRILGRRGVTDVTLIAGLDQLNTAIPQLAKVLAGYTYDAGGSYAEYRKGDKVAKYGLTALVAGGAAAVALKSGLLAKFWKLIVVGVAAVGAYFKKLFGKKDQ